jgi:hypothetical protein
MSIGIRAMREGQEEAVAVLIRQLPKDLGLATVPKMTGQNLRDARRVLVHYDLFELAGMLWNLYFRSLCFAPRARTKNW